MIPSPRRNGEARSAGFSLVEVVLAIGVISFAMVALIALLPKGLQIARDSTEEMRAINLASAVSADLQGTPLTNVKSGIFQITPIPWVLNASQVTVPNPGVVLNTDYVFYSSEGQGMPAGATSEARYRITLRYTQVPGKSSNVPVTSPAAIEALLKVSWPPAVDPTNAQGQVDSYLVFAKP